MSWLLKSLEEFVGFIPVASSGKMTESRRQPFNKCSGAMIPDGWFVGLQPAHQHRCTDLQDQLNSMCDRCAETHQQSILPKRT